MFKYKKYVNSVRAPISMNLNFEKDLTIEQDLYDLLPDFYDVNSPEALKYVEEKV